MGNCLFLQEKAAKVMKTNGEILEHKSPIKVDYQVLSKLSHATCDEHLVVKNMHPNAQVLQNHLHLATKTTTTTTKKKKVRFSEKVIEGGGDQTSGVVRIKVVISKKELQKMASEGQISVNGVIMKVQNQEITNKAESKDHRDGVIPKGWFPALESIPEIN